MEGSGRGRVIAGLSVALCFFVLFEVNYSLLQPQSALAVFVGFGLVLSFLAFPLRTKWRERPAARLSDGVLALLAAVCCGYVVVQTEPMFRDYWSNGQALASRAGIETTGDFVVGLVGLVLVFEATRRSIGWIVPAMALVFVGHSFYCYLSYRHGLPVLPDFLLPHAGQSLKDVVSTTFLQTLGVFGPAASVMFRYVFLFVLFGSFLEMSGATRFIMSFAKSVFKNSAGGPAKVSVLSSGLMGSLSGSAVANAVTTGTFTIPMMRSVGFERHIAGAVEAAAATGGALVPPVMGAAAYMMIEIVEPQVTFLEIARAAFIPAVLYYFSLFMIVHFYAGGIGARRGAAQVDSSLAEKIPERIQGFDALVFFGALGTLVTLLLLRFSPFRAVTGALLVILLLSLLRRELDLPRNVRLLAFGSFFGVLVLHRLMFAETLEGVGGRQVFVSWLDSSLMAMFGLLIFGLVHSAWRPTMLEALVKAARNGIALIAASACVGVIIGVVQQTGVAADFSAAIKGLVATNLLLALIGIMFSSILLGMGVPSVVCYLLLATLMGSLLTELGVIPLAAHLFIFYFGMMSMVTPPVALAAYAAASIAEAKIMPTALAAFRFALVGFTLPYMFIYRPALLLMDADGASLFSAEDGLIRLLVALGASLIGIVALAAGIVGFFKAPLAMPARGMLLVAAALLLAPNLGGIQSGRWVNLAGAVLFTILAAVNWKRSREIAV